MTNNVTQHPAANKSGDGERRAEPLAWFANYPGDNLRTMRAWPLAARGAFHGLLDAQWDAPLPVNPSQLRALIGANATEWRTVWPLIQQHFPIVGDHRENFALEVLRGEAQQKRAAKSRAAQAANAKRWGHK